MPHSTNKSFRGTPLNHQSYY